MRQKNSAVSFLPIAGCLFVLGVLTACGSSKPLNRDSVYFQNGADTVQAPQKQNLIQPNDILGIQVYSKTLNQDQAVVFNMPAALATQGYQVNPAGNIDMPVIGPVKAVGLTKDELQNLLLQKLATYVKNPSVLVHFLQFNINVLGEVRTPGTQRFTTDRVTVIDAIGAAGDLTDYGRREDVMVIREQGGKKIYHTVDLRSKAVFESPFYILQPNDVVYVAPNKNKLKILSVDPEKQRKTTLFFTITSIVIGLAALVITSLR